MSPIIVKYLCRFNVQWAQLMWNFCHFKVQWAQVIWNFCVVLRFSEHNVSLLTNVHSWTVIHTMYISLLLWTLILQTVWCQPSVLYSDLTDCVMSTFSYVLWSYGLCDVTLQFCTLILRTVWCQPSVLYSDLTDCVMSAFGSVLWSFGLCDVSLRFCTYKLCNDNFQCCTLQSNLALLGCNIQSHLKKKILKLKSVGGSSLI